jgi:A/G-specific adenine glycosylase
LPWRRTTDPYAITVSEIMLQQTQVVTVIPFYERWLKVFPSWTALAAAKEHDVIKAWEGLGYYRRARNLQALAKAVMQNGGAMPRSEDGLRALPGFGPYTAAAVGSIAFGLPLAVVDGNVMRVLTRLLALRDDIALPQTRAKLQAIADNFLDKRDPSTHNQAIMELGATVCVPGTSSRRGISGEITCCANQARGNGGDHQMGQELLLRASARGKTMAWPLALSRFRPGAHGAGRRDRDNQIWNHKILGNNDGHLRKMEITRTRHRSLSHARENARARVRCTASEADAITGGQPLA